MLGAAQCSAGRSKWPRHILQDQDCHAASESLSSAAVHLIRTRRDFLSLAGKGLGLAALSSATVASFQSRIEAATKTMARLTPEEAAMDEDYWAVIQNA